jgi:uncharacterized RDD family membrane protein YckC
VSAYEKWLEERGSEVASRPAWSAMSGGFSERGRLAEPMTRLVAQIVDLVAGLGAVLPGIACLIAGIIVAAGAPSDQPPPAAGILFLAGVGLIAVGGLAIGIYQIVLLSQRGQTIGKRYMRVKIVRMDHRGPAGFVHAWLLRSFVPGLIGSIPFGVGALFGLVDILFIMREDRRCIHDLIAGTQVVEA